MNQNGFTYRGGRVADPALDDAALSKHGSVGDFREMMAAAMASHPYRNPQPPAYEWPEAAE